MHHHYLSPLVRYLDVLVSSVALIQFVMARAKRRAVANKATQRRTQAIYKCPLCDRFFTKLATRTRHMRMHDMRSPTRNTQSIAPPSNNLLSRQASDDVVIFNFNANATINSSSHLRHILIAADATISLSSYHRRIGIVIAPLSSYCNSQHNNCFVFVS